MVAMAVSRQWMVDLLRHLGYAAEADEAARVLPDPVDLEQVRKFADRHGISRSELMDRLGSSP